MTEETGFPDEPTFNLAALAGQELLQERIRDLENERAGKVLVDPEDLREVLLADLVREGPQIREVPAWERLYAAAGAPADGPAGLAAGDGSTTGSEAVSVDLRDAP